MKPFTLTTSFNIDALQQVFITFFLLHLTVCLTKFKPSEIYLQNTHKNILLEETIFFITCQLIFGNGFWL